MKRFAVALLCAMLLIGSVVPTEARAATAKTVYILNVETDGARVRKDPNSGTDNVEVSMKKGTKVFYLGESGAPYAPIRPAIVGLVTFLPISRSKPRRTASFKNVPP